MSFDRLNISRWCPSMTEGKLWKQGRGKRIKKIDTFTNFGTLTLSFRYMESITDWIRIKIFLQIHNLLPMSTETFYIWIPRLTRTSLVMHHKCLMTRCVNIFYEPTMRVIWSHLYVIRIEKYWCQVNVPIVSTLRKIDSGIPEINK